MIKNKYPGKFIVFEGLDGSGQTTQAGLLKDFLISKGYEVILTKEPTLDSEAGKKIRKVLDKEEKVSPLELQNLFVKDRQIHLKNVIIPALESRKMVISDRYFFSTFAFGSSEGLALEELIELNKDFLLPDLTFILRVSPKICLERIENRGKAKTYFERLEKLEKVWQTYEILPNRFENTHLIDGEKSIAKVHQDVKTLLQQKLGVK